MRARRHEPASDYTLRIGDHDVPMLRLKSTHPQEVREGDKLHVLLDNPRGVITIVGEEAIVAYFEERQIVAESWQKDNDAAEGWKEV